MKNMTLENIAKACAGTFYGDAAKLNTEVHAIAIDSRKIGVDDLFVAVKGERSDGHSFIPQVINNGALCALGEIPVEEVREMMQGEPLNYIQVESTLKALREVAAYYRSTLQVKVVGITGSVGKTSTKEMIANVLGTHYRVHKTAGNFNNEIGLPLTVFGIDETHEVAVLEMGIGDFGEMYRLSEIARPDVMVITNIGWCHLENLITRDGILKAKTECFANLNDGASVVLNGDDDKLITVETVQGKMPVFYSILKDDECTCDFPVYATELDNQGLEGIDVTLHVYGESVRVHEPLPGEHNISNALAAAGVAHLLGLTIEEIKEGVEHATTIQGRSNFIRTNRLTIIDDCYNANPVSMKASIDVLEKATGRSIAVLGDMGELGTDEKALHYDVGEHVAKSGINVLFTAGPLSAEIARACADAASIEVHSFADKDALLKDLLTYVKEGDTVLVKASHFMGYTQIVEALQQF